MRLTCDDAKWRANLAKHGLDFADVTLAIFDSEVVQAAKGQRLKLVGWLGERPVAMIFQPLGAEAIAIVSLRPASARERRYL